MLIFIWYIVYNYVQWFLSVRIRIKWLAFYKYALYSVKSINMPENPLEIEKVQGGEIFKIFSDILINKFFVIWNSSNFTGYPCIKHDKVTIWSKRCAMLFYEVSIQIFLVYNHNPRMIHKHPIYKWAKYTTRQSTNFICSFLIREMAFALLTKRINNKVVVAHKFKRDYLAFIMSSY